jgi:hypothetical protein
MQTETIVYIILAGTAALLLALFQYIYISKIKSNLKYLLFALRTITIFSILLLLINPKFESLSFYDQKPNLILAIDNSQSISYLKQDETSKLIVNLLIENTELNNRFNIEAFTFGKDLYSLDSLNFKEKQSNISQALRQIGEAFSNQTAPIVLIGDGNQTYGTDYSFLSSSIKQPVYPLILGDSTVYADLSIRQLNVNGYVFLKNKFPVEIIANYNGKSEVVSEVRIWSGNSMVFKKNVSFSSSKNSEIISTALLANSVGVKTYRVEIVPLQNEKNTVNNSKNFGVEVIDQKTNIALVSDQLHPDLGALKKSIESNEQRSVTILKPNKYLDKINDFQVVILYQPNNKFTNVLKRLEQDKINSFVIVGATTNWNLLNNSQSNFKHAITNQTEDYQPSLNRNFNTFIVDNIDFNNFPPLKSEFGDFGISVPHDVLLYKAVNGILTNQIMLVTFEADGTKNAILNGEDIWRWRAQSYLETEKFNDFDNFINKLIQYLATNKKRRRINIDYKSFYNGNDDIIISAQYFNKNFEFDPKASLSIQLKNKSTARIKEVPLLLENGNYVVDLSGLDAGSYDFSVKHNEESVTVSGSFQVLEYNVEQQFLNADIEKLESLAFNSDGKAFFNTEYDKLISDLLSDNRYATIQKSTKNIVPLIDWKYLLGLIAISLFLEWFIRKYNGLI